LSDARVATAAAASAAMRELALSYSFLTYQQSFDSFNYPLKEKIFPSLFELFSSQSCQFSSVMVMENEALTPLIICCSNFAFLVF
jgi:hypothetical protein